jgi:transcription elongation factor GreA
MAVKYKLSEGVFSRLLEHLVEIEDRRDELVEQYFSNLSEEANQFKEILAEYIEKLDQLIQNSHKEKTQDSSFPFVIIGSQVEVKDVENSELCSFRIVAPYEGGIGVDCASCLSPVGKALLMKEIGDQIEVKTPGGSISYEITAINY